MMAENYIALAARNAFTQFVCRDKVTRIYGLTSRLADRKYPRDDGPSSTGCGSKYVD